MTIVNDEDLPVGMKERQKIAHQIAHQACEQVWNIALQACDKISKQITGVEALSYMGTILSDFAGRWISMMDVVRLEDNEAGILREEMIKELMNGILATIGCTASYEEENPLPDGIKKLNKDKTNG